MTNRPIPTLPLCLAYWHAYWWVSWSVGCAVAEGAQRMWRGWR